MRFEIFDYLKYYSVRSIYLKVPRRNIISCWDTYNIERDGAIICTELPFNFVENFIETV